MAAVLASAMLGTGNSPTAMRLRSKALIGALIVSVAGCASIPPYSVTVPPSTTSLLPPSKQLADYTDDVGLSLQLDRTTTFCGVVKQRIASEIDQRDRRLTTRKSVLLLLGSAAALSVTIYSGIQDTPKKEVIVPLSAISGGSLLTVLPSLGKDERSDALREKLATIKVREGAVIESWNALERGMLGVSLLKGHLEDAAKGSTAAGQVQMDLEAKYNELAPIEERFRTALAALANDCS